MSKQGASLIETMVAMVLLIIICLSSAYFFTIPPFRKEALRFASLERAAGMLDLLSAEAKIQNLPGINNYEVVDYSNVSTFPSFTNLGVDVSMQPLCSPWTDDDGSTKDFRVIYYICDIQLRTISGISVPEASLFFYDERDKTNSLFATFKMILPPGS